MTQPIDEQLAVLGLVIDVLQRFGVQRMVSGSLTASYYVEPRMTRDVDIVVDLPVETAAGLAGALATDFYCDEGALVRAATERSMANAIHNETLLKVDLIVRKDDAFHCHEFGRRVRRQLGPVEVDLVTAEDLVLSKLLWCLKSRSAVQRSDIGRLLRDTTLDLAYVEQWATRLGVAELLEEIRRE